MSAVCMSWARHQVMSDPILVHAQVKWWLQEGVNTKMPKDNERGMFTNWEQQARDSFQSRAAKSSKFVTIQYPVLEPDETESDSDSDEDDEKEDEE